MARSFRNIPRGATSYVWKYFVLTEKENQVKCTIMIIGENGEEKVCNEQVARGGTIKSKFTTSNMVKHLELDHNAIYKKEKLLELQLKDAKAKKLAAEQVSTYFKPVEQVKQTPAPKRRRLNSGEFGNCSQASDVEFSLQNSHDPRGTSQKVLQVQPMVSEFFGKKKMWGRNDLNSKKLDFVIGQMIAADKEPFNMVEHWGLEFLCEEMFPKYTLPSRHHITNSVIPFIYDISKAKIKNMLDDVAFVSIDTDLWSNLAKKNFISLMAHCTFPNFDQQLVVLNSKPFNESHTGHNICNIMKDMIKEWEIPPHKIHNIIHDNASNMNLGLEGECEYASLRCFIHTTQLVVKDTILTQKSVQNVLDKARLLNKHLRQSTNSKNALVRVLKSLKMNPELMTKGDLEVRWDSQREMLLRIIEMKLAIIQLYHELDVAPDVLKKFEFTTADWVTMHKVCALFGQFHKITKTMSKKYANASEIIPWIAMVKELVNNLASSLNVYGLMETVKLMRTSVDERFERFLVNKSCILSTYLDPRFRLPYFKPTRDIYSMHTKESIEESVIEEFLEINCKAKVFETLQGNLDNPDTVTVECVDTVTDVTPFTPESPVTVNEDPSSEVFGHTFDIAMSIFDEPPIPDDSDEIVDTSRLELQREMRKYNSQDKTNYDIPAHTWWKKNREVFPLMSQVALKYLSSPPSSVDSERLFSQAGQICTQKRTRLTSEHCEMLQFLTVNLKVHGGLKYENYAD